MEVRSSQFKSASQRALLDQNLQSAMAKARDGFVGKRAISVDEFGEFEKLRDSGRDIKNYCLNNLDELLIQFEKSVVEKGGQVHWAETARDAQRIVSEICEEVHAKHIVKSKSMVSEEVALNEALERDGFEVLETDLGEYIIQLAGESPSHIIAPAIHKTKEQISTLFQQHHGGEKLESVADLVNDAREVLRQKFIDADVGITGANFLIAESGRGVIITNEGNADLAHSLPNTHIMITGIEKVIPGYDELSTLIRLLGRSATGQTMSVYTTVVGADVEGGEVPKNFHVVLVDNGRSEIANSQFREVLRCIRCGACMNHCPVYGVVGGHAYGWVYPGPIGSVLTPRLVGEKNAKELPQACTLNGHCQSVCPVRIPLTDLIREHRVLQFEKRMGSAWSKLNLKAWAFLVQRPRLYRLVVGFARKFMNLIAGRKGYLSWMPMSTGWFSQRTMTIQEGNQFKKELEAAADE